MLPRWRRFDQIARCGPIASEVVGYTKVGGKAFPEYIPSHEAHYLFPCVEAEHGCEQDALF